MSMGAMYEHQCKVTALTLQHAQKAPLAPPPSRHTPRTAAPSWLHVYWMLRYGLQVAAPLSPVYACQATPPLKFKNVKIKIINKNKNKNKDIKTLVISQRKPHFYRKMIKK